MKLFCFILLFIFAEISANNLPCNMESGFIEPKQKAFIYKKLKLHSASIDDLRKFIANDNNCDIHDITFLKITDYKEGGKYEVCINNKSMIYNRLIFNFIKNTNKPDNSGQLVGCTLPFKFKTYTLWERITSYLAFLLSLILFSFISYYLLLIFKQIMKVL